MNNFDKSHSRWLDPPETPEYGECERCGGYPFNNDDLHKHGSWEYICDDCLEELEEEEKAKHLSLGHVWGVVDGKPQWVDAGGNEVDDE